MDIQSTGVGHRVVGAGHDNFFASLTGDNEAMAASASHARRGRQAVRPRVANGRLSRIPYEKHAPVSRPAGARPRQICGPRLSSVSRFTGSSGAFLHSCWVAAHDLGSDSRSRTPLLVHGDHGSRSTAAFKSHSGSSMWRMIPHRRWSAPGPGCTSSEIRLTRRTASGARLLPAPHRSSSDRHGGRYGRAGRRRCAPEGTSVD